MRTWLSRLLDPVLRRSRERRLDEEMQSHLDFLADEFVGKGMSPVDARIAARKAFGGVDQIKERYHDQRGLPFLDTLMQDVRFASRLMRKNPLFFITAGGSLALSIGALSMAFSIVNAFVFKPLPIKDAGSVYFMQGGWSYPDYRDLTERLDVEALATGEQLTAFPLLPYRAGVIALGLLGVIASGLLLSGLHALLAYAVVKRRREIGIRVALGADRATVIRAVLNRVLVIVAVGGGVGAVMAAGIGPVISSMVLGVSPGEPLLIVAIVSLIAVIALFSCAGPVRRSLRIDPLVALRED